MRLAMPVLDNEIREVELRLARRRSGVAALGDDWVGALRDALVSGKSLFGVAAVGFALGEMLRGPPGRAGRTRSRRGVGAIVLGLAGLLLRARFGSPWQLVWSAVAASRRQRPAVPASVYRD
jgi:hypothetical protein